MVDRRAKLAPLARSLTFALWLGAVVAACGDDEPGFAPGPGKPDGGGGRGGTAGTSAGRGGASGNSGTSGTGGAAGSAGDAGASGAAGSAGSAGDSGMGGTTGGDASADANTSDGGGIVNVCARLGNLTVVQNEFVQKYIGEMAADCRVRSFILDNPQLPLMGDKLRQLNVVFWGCDTSRPIPGFHLVHFWNANTTLTSADAQVLIDIYVRVARFVLTLTLAEDTKMRAELARLSQSVITEQSGRYSRNQCDAGSPDGGTGDAGSDAGVDADDASVSDSSDDGAVSDSSDDTSDGNTDNDGADE
jgi:hypothetical protein